MSSVVNAVNYDVVPCRDATLKKHNGVRVSSKQRNIV